MQRDGEGRIGAHRARKSQSRNIVRRRSTSDRHGVAVNHSAVETANGTDAVTNQLRRSQEPSSLVFEIQNPSRFSKGRFHFHAHQHQGSSHPSCLPYATWHATKEKHMGLSSETTPAASGTRIPLVTTTKDRRQTTCHCTDEAV